MYQKKATRGFTFIELMVSIAIIGVLSVALLAGVDRIRKNARVAERVSDLKRVQAALDLYYAQNKAYPTTGDVWRGVCASYSAGGTYTANNGLVIPGLAPTYIPRIPVDPQSNPASNANCYLYRSNGIDYAFRIDAVAEFTSADYLSRSELVDPYRDGVANTVVDGVSPSAWKVYSPGGVGF